MSEDKVYTEDELKEFVPLTCCKDIKDIYEINRLGEVRNRNTEKILSKIIERDGYVVYNLVTINKDSRNRTISKLKRAHRLVAETFIKNEKNLPIIDHIDGNRENNIVTNLRWASFSLNSRNSNKTNINIKTRIRYKKLDDSKKEIERLEIKKILKIFKISESYFHKCVKNQKKCCGYYWERVDIELEKYINKYNIDLSTEDWKIWKRGDYSIECSRNGLLKNPKLTVGNLNNHGYYRVKLSGNKKNFFVHTIIYEAFSGETLKEGEVIDHINTDSEDNRFDNLRKCSQKGNLNNLLTLEKKSIPVFQYSLSGDFIRKYKSHIDVFDQLKIKVSSGKRLSHYGYFWCKEGNELEIIDKINNCIYCYRSKNDKLPENCTINWKNHPSLKTCGKDIKNCILTGQPHPKTGYYYSLGLKNWETGEQIIPDVTPKLEEENKK